MHLIASMQSLETVPIWLRSSKEVIRAVYVKPIVTYYSTDRAI